MFNLCIIFNIMSYRNVSFSVQWYNLQIHTNTYIHKSTHTHSELNKSKHCYFPLAWFGVLSFSLTFLLCLFYFILSLHTHALTCHRFPNHRHVLFDLQQETKSEHFFQIEKCKGRVRVNIKANWYTKYRKNKKKTIQIPNATIRNENIWINLNYGKW